MSEYSPRRVCFLVLAHHQSRVFHKLIDTLSVEAVDIVVHIDKRTNMADFERSESNVFFVKPRRRVHWAGWNQAKTILATMKFALSCSDAEYFVFLAGTDFPIVHPRKFLGHLSSEYPTNFLNHYPVVCGIWGYGLCAQFHFVDSSSDWALDDI